MGLNKRGDAIILRKIIEEIEYLENTLAGLTFESYMSNEDKKRVSAMTLINIGELTRHISKELKEAHREIPFKNAMALRDVAAHGYHSLRFADIWETIQIHVPELKAQIKKIMH